MERSYGAFAIERAIPLFDGSYFDFLGEAIDRTRERFWASIFLVNVVFALDPDRRVRSVLKGLASKRRLGVDVRVIVGVSLTADIQLTNRVATGYLAVLGVPARAYRGPRHNTHNKVIIVDNYLSIIGSHNWTDSAFAENIEDSIAVYSPGMNYELARQFLATWVD